MRLGILSDTHGLLRDEVIHALDGCDYILHGGDVCSPDILFRLQAIAKVYAVRGNADSRGMEFLPERIDMELEGLRIFMTHRKKDLPDSFGAYDLMICGHSHQYSMTTVGKTIVLNPGSCGPRRFHLPVTMAIAETGNGTISVQRMELVSGGKQPSPADMHRVIETVLKESQKGMGYQQIAAKHGYSSELTEQIIRLYVTHPGVSVEGIMSKMGL